jgi:hypothetical protein
MERPFNTSDYIWYLYYEHEQHGALVQYIAGFVRWIHEFVESRAMSVGIYILLHRINLLLLEGFQGNSVFYYYTNICTNK